MSNPAKMTVDFEFISEQIEREVNKKYENEIRALQEKLAEEKRRRIESLRYALGLGMAAPSPKRIEGPKEEIPELPLQEQPAGIFAGVMRQAIERMQGRYAMKDLMVEILKIDKDADDLRHRNQLSAFLGNQTDKLVRVIERRGGRQGNIYETIRPPVG